MGTQNGVKWWIHQKTVPEPPFHKKNMSFYGEKVQKSCGKSQVRVGKGGVGPLKETKKLRS